MTAAAMTVSLMLAGCAGGKSNKEATQLPPPPPLESEPLPASLATPPAPVASSPQPIAPGPELPPEVPPAPQEAAVAHQSPTYYAPPAAPQVEQRIYRVQKGDTLWSIARRHYGDGHAWEAIARANNLTNPSQLKAGQDIILP